MEKQKDLFDEIEEQTKKKKDIFMHKLKSQMNYDSNVNSDELDFEWLEQISFACPYIDNVIRIPKLALVKVADVINIERSKKTTVESVKDLAKHTDYISKYDEETGYVEPEKILNIFSEETYDIYENRFLFTLIEIMKKFIWKKEEELKNLEIIEYKNIDYIGQTVTTTEKVNIEFRIKSESYPSAKMDDKTKDEIRKAKEKIKTIKEYISSWDRSPMIKELIKLKIRLINPPLKKTNILLKNPNFKVAVKLWDYLQKYEMNENEGQEGLEDNEQNPLQGFLDHSFLIDYCVLDSISKSKREQKQKMAKYAVLILTQEIERTIALLLNSGIEITEDELLGMIAKEMKNNKNKRLVGAGDVKDKFKSAIDEYLERTQGML